MRSIGSKIAFWVLMVNLVVLACNLPSQAVDDDEAIAAARETLEAEMTQEAAAGEVEGGQATPEAGEEQPASTPTTPQPTATYTATLTPTPSIPMVSVSVNTNCRKGPGAPYEIIGYLLVGEEAVVVGKDEWGISWIIENPDAAGNCWLWGQYASVEGDIEPLPVMTPPPTPTPTLTPTPVIDWTGQWSHSNLWGIMADPIPLTQTNQQVSGSVTEGVWFFTISGSLSGDSTLLTGGYTANVAAAWSNGSASLLMINQNQFRGHIVNNAGTDTMEFCGARNGAALPVPCFGP